MKKDLIPEREILRTSTWERHNFGTLHVQLHTNGYQHLLSSVVDSCLGRTKPHFNRKWRRPGFHHPHTSPPKLHRLAHNSVSMLELHTRSKTTGSLVQRLKAHPAARYKSLRIPGRTRSAATISSAARSTWIRTRATQTRAIRKIHFIPGQASKEPACSARLLWTLCFPEGTPQRSKAQRNMGRKRQYEKCRFQAMRPCYKECPETARLILYQAPVFCSHTRY